MKSKIFLDFDQDTKPFIQITHDQASKDIKDKMLRIFLETPNFKDRNNIALVASADKILLSLEEDRESVEHRNDGSIFAEYIIKPYGWSYLLTAEKKVEENSQEHKDYCSVNNLGQTAQYRENHFHSIKYKIKTEEVSDYLRKGYTVTFADQFECNALNHPQMPENGFVAIMEDKWERLKVTEIINYLQQGYPVRFGEYEFVKLSNNKTSYPSSYKNAPITLTFDKDNDEILDALEERAEWLGASIGYIEEFKIKWKDKLIAEDLQLIKNGEFDFNMFERFHANKFSDNLTKIHIANLISKQTTVIIESGHEVYDKVIKILEDEYGVQFGEYAVISEIGLRTINLSKKIESKKVSNNLEQNEIKTVKKKCTTAKIEANKKGEEVLFIASNGYISDQCYIDLGQVEKYIRNGFTIEIKVIKGATNIKPQPNILHKFDECDRSTAMNDQLIENKLIWKLEKTGRTTRLVDMYIQKLFAGEEIVVRDHIDNPGSHTSLFDKIIRRLKNEHNISPSLTYDLFEKLDKNSLVIKLNLNLINFDLEIKD